MSLEVFGDEGLSGPDGYVTDERCDELLVEAFILGAVWAWQTWSEEITLSEQDERREQASIVAKEKLANGDLYDL